MSAKNEPCPVCTQQGLAILPARYAIEAPDNEAPSLAFSGERVTGAALQTSQYTARLLRQGFLYLFYEKGPGGRNYWEAYSVSPKGGLHKELDVDSARPRDHTATCSRCSSPLTRDYLVMAKPDKCTTVWVAFSEVKWSEATRTRYETKSVREKRMQPIRPKDWIKSAQAGNHQLPLNAGGDLEAIAEYSPAYGGMMPMPLEEVSQADGWHCAISPRHSRYEVAGRRGVVVSVDRTTGEPIDFDPLESLISQMREASPDPKGGEGAHHTPMLLALWDAVGIVHELNTHRSEPMAYYARYADERVFEVEGLRLMDEAKVAVEHRGEADFNERYLKRRQGTYSHKEGYYAGGTRGPDQARVQRGISQWANDTMASHNISNQYVLLEERYILGEIDEGELHAERDQLRRTHLNAPNGEDNAFWRQRAAQARAQHRQVSEDRRAAVQDSWSKYEERLNDTQLTNFRTRFANLKREVDRLQGERTADLRTWLFEELFHDTLLDYDPEEYDPGQDRQDCQEGLAFREVIEEALDGLSSEPQGQMLLQVLIDNTDATDDRSLYWRAVALNQRQVREELSTALAQAEAQKETPLATENGWSEAGWTIYSGAVAGLKGLADVYTTRDDFGRPSRPAYQGSVARAIGADRLLLAAGNQVFGKWRIGRLGDYLGEKLVQHVFLTTAGVPQADIEALVRSEARHQPALRRDVMARWRALRAQNVNPNHAFAVAVSEAAERNGSRLMAEGWQKARQGIRPTSLAQHRLAMVVALCEGANFAKLVATAGDDDVTAGMLVASGLSTVGAAAMVAIDPLSRVLQEGSKAMYVWRTVGGTLSGAASIIMGWGDAWAGVRQLKSEYISIGLLYIAKGFVGLAAGGGFIVSALSSSYRLIQSMGGRSGARRMVVVVVEQVGVVVARNAAVRQTLLVVGRVLLRVAGWKVTVVLLIIEGLIWYFTPDAMEKWIDQTAFGNKQRFAGVNQQQEEFDQMLAEMGYR